MKRFRVDKNNYENGHQGGKRESIKVGVAKVFTSLLMTGGSIAVYFFSLHKKALTVVTALVWTYLTIFFLFGLILMVIGVKDIIYNLILIKKKLPRENHDYSKIFINTNPVSGIIAFLMSIAFTLTNIFLWYPKYKAGETDFVGVIVFIILGALLFIYSVFVLLYNLIKRK